MNADCDRENEDKRNHLENRETANNAVIHGGENQRHNEESTVQRVSHHRRKGEEFEHLY